jgi:hypothetical protein
MGGRALGKTHSGFPNAVHTQLTLTGTSLITKHTKAAHQPQPTALPGPAHCAP